MIVNAYKMDLRKIPKMPVGECRIIISRQLGIRKRTVTNLLINIILL